VDAADKAADPFERLVVAELGRAPAAARIEGDAEIGEAQRVRRRDHRDLALGELARERVLLVDLLRPTSGPADRTSPPPPHFSFRRPRARPGRPGSLAIEAEQAPVGLQAAAATRVEHPIGREERVGCAFHG